MSKKFMLAPDKIHNAQEFLDQQTQIVYAWYRAPNYLYVGVSRHGRHRVDRHSVIGVVEEVQPQDELHFWEVNDDTVKLDEYEYRLITAFMPKYNIQHNTKKNPRKKAPPPKFEPHKVIEQKLVDGKWITVD